MSDHDARRLERLARQNPLDAGAWERWRLAVVRSAVDTRADLVGRMASHAAVLRARAQRLERLAAREGRSNRLTLVARQVMEKIRAVDHTISILAQRIPVDLVARWGVVPMTMVRMAVSGRRDRTTMLAREVEMIGGRRRGQGDLCACGHGLERHSHEGRACSACSCIDPTVSLSSARAILGRYPHRLPPLVVLPLVPPPHRCPRGPLLPPVHLHRAGVLGLLGLD